MVYTFITYSEFTSKIIVHMADYLQYYNTSDVNDKTMMITT